MTVSLIDYPGNEAALQGTRTVIAQKDADDSEPTIGSGIDASGFAFVRVEATVGGTAAGWTITPCYGYSGDTLYKHGDSVEVSTADDSRVVFTVPSYGASDFVLRCDGSYGTSPTLDLVLTPYGG